MSGEICESNANLQPFTVEHDQIFSKAEEWLNKGKNVAIATVVHTWGSSPRPVGSQLIVSEDAQFEGSVSGGCIESSVVNDALEIMESGKAQLLEFGISDAMAWEVGLACGGKVKVYVKKVGGMNDISFRRILNAKKSSEAIVSITNFDTGMQEIWNKNVDNSNTAVDAACIRAMRTDKGQLITSEEGIELFINPFNPPMKMFITGAVHISQALAPMAQSLGYDVTVIDHRTAWATNERFPNITLDKRWADEVLKEQSLNHRCAIVTLTHDPKLDDPALVCALGSSAFYVGALGSKKTHAARVGRLKDQGFNEDEIARIDAPIGLDIGASSPAEIAVAILGQVTLALRGSKNSSGKN